MEKEIEVRATEKYKEVPTPYGVATQKRFILVCNCTYIRNRIRDGELEVKEEKSKKKAKKNLRKSA